MITREKKAEIVEKLKKAFGDSKSVVFVNFKGLSVADAFAMRRALKEEGISYTVARKTLMKRALDSVDIKGDQPELKGEVAIAYGNDLVAPARNIFNFFKKLDGKVSIAGGIFDGRYMSREEMNEIATILPLPVLRGMFVNIINAPIQRFAVVLNQIAEKKV